MKRIVVSITEAFTAQLAKLHASVTKNTFQRLGKLTKW
jgi:hypothetical protein